MLSHSSKGTSMKINLSGHHVDVTDSIKDHINGKFSKIETHFPTLISLDVILSQEHHKHNVELCTTYEGGRIFASANDEVMYPAISAAVKKLDAALKHRKGLLKANLHSKPVSAAPEVVHEHIQEMK